MSIEREVKLVEGLTPPVLTPEQEEAEMRAKRRARLVHILERGVMHDRMKVDLPPGIHGEWARNRPEDIYYMQSLGFEVASGKDFKVRGTNANATEGDGIVVGDVIFMTCPKDLKDDIDAIRLEQFYAKNGKPGDNVGREEKDFQKLTQAGTGGIIPTTVESKTSTMSLNEVARAVAEADRQITPIPT